MAGNWLLSPGTSSQSEGYSSKWLIWLVCREPLIRGTTLGYISCAQYYTVSVSHSTCSCQTTSVTYILHDTQTSSGQYFTTKISRQKGLSIKGAILVYAGMYVRIDRGACKQNEDSSFNQDTMHGPSYTYIEKCSKPPLKRGHLL